MAFIEVEARGDMKCLPRSHDAIKLYGNDGMHGRTTTWKLESSGSVDSQIGSACAVRVICSARNNITRLGTTAFLLCLTALGLRFQ